MDLMVFQTLVRRWCVRAFGQGVADDRRERVHRFLEEALELGQSLGCTHEDAHVLVDYVYGRPSGRPGQEVGGTMVTLAALCAAQGIELSVNNEAATELARINRPETLEKIRGKQAAKARDIPLSPLPGRVGSTSPPPPMHCPTCNTMRNTYRAGDGDSAGAGAVCCGHCSRILLTPKPAFTPPGQGASMAVPTDTKCLVTGKTLGEVLDASHGFMSEDDHCEICAPQEKRMQGMRCGKHRERTHTDAVGTDGGKATVARKI